MQIVCLCLKYISLLLPRCDKGGLGIVREGVEGGEAMNALRGQR